MPTRLFTMPTKNFAMPTAANLPKCPCGFGHGKVFRGHGKFFRGHGKVSPWALGRCPRPTLPCPQKTLPKCPSVNFYVGMEKLSIGMAKFAVVRDIPIWVVPGPPGRVVPGAPPPPPLPHGCSRVPGRRVSWGPRTRELEICSVPPFLNPKP